MLPLPTPPGKNAPGYGQAFVPTVMYGSIWLILALFIALIILALNFPADIGDPADPLNKSYFLPRPEWYFLSLFQVLKIFQGPWELVGTVVLPGIISMLLILLPFYDRNWSKRPGKRPLAMTLITASMVGLLALTWVSQGDPLPFTGTTTAVAGGGNSGSSSGGSGGSGGTTSSKVTFASVSTIFQNNCAQCHITIASGGLKLDNYADVMKGGSTSAGGVVNGVVVKGDHTKSYLWDAVEGVNLQGGQRMPLGGPYLSAGDINTIAQWIDQGANP